MCGCQHATTAASFDAKFESWQKTYEQMTPYLGVTN